MVPIAKILFYAFLPLSYVNLISEQFTRKLYISYKKRWFKCERTTYRGKVVMRNIEIEIYRQYKMLRFPY